MNTVDYTIPQKIGPYSLMEVIGAGAFSVVYHGMDDRVQLPVAVKAISKKKFDGERLKGEINMLKSLDCPFCVSFYDYLEDNNNYYLIMEYIQGKTILKEINFKGALPEFMCRHIFCQLISALEYLHQEKKIVHRDLKSENIILDKYGNIRLIDFGLSKVFLSKNCLLQTACGSPCYAPPEMFRGEKYNFTADLWSAGVVLYSMAVGKLPFEDKNIQRLVNKILTEEPEYPDTLDPLLVDLLRRMLMKDASCRMSIKKIREHSWFTQYHFASLMKADFGLIQGFKVHDNNIFDNKIAAHLDKLGLNGDEIVELAKRDVFSSEVTPYRILHRNQVMANMRGMYATAEKSDELDKIALNKKVKQTKTNPLMQKYIESINVKKSYKLDSTRKMSLSLPEKRDIVINRSISKQGPSSFNRANYYRTAVITSMTKMPPNSVSLQRPRGYSFI